MVAAWAGDEGALCEAEAMRKATGTTALWVEATAQEAVDLVASTGPVAVVVWALGKVAATQAVVMLVMTAAAAVDWAAMARVRAQGAVARLRATVVMTRDAVVAAIPPPYCIWAHRAIQGSSLRCTPEIQRWPSECPERDPPAFIIH